MPLEDASFFKAAWMATLSLKTGRALVFSLRVLEPNSEGMKRLTWALAAASTKRSWVAIAMEARVETTASWPWRALVRDSRES
jgi:hypothetical protein